MKKFWIIFFIAAAGAAVFLTFYYSRPSSALSSSAPSAGIRGASSSESPSGSSRLSESSENPVLSSREPSSRSAETGSAEKARAQIKLDWDKYQLKPAAEKKTLGGKTYDTFEIWDEDYQQGLRILVDPDNGGVFTFGPSDTSPVPAAEDKAFDKTPRTVTGVMEDGAMMSILLKLPDGNKITVRRLGIDTSKLKSMNIGDKIKVTYTGVLNGTDTSRMFVKKLENA